MSSVTPLRPLAESFLDWLNLPNPSRWLLRTIQLGYAIQFARRLPRYRSVLFTSVRGENAAVLHVEIETVPSAKTKKGFYSPYFIVPKKGGGLRLILDPRVLNWALHKVPFKMLTLKHIPTCVRAQDWFVAIDLKDAYFQSRSIQDTGRSCDLPSKVGLISTRFFPSASPCRPYSVGLYRQHSDGGVHQPPGWCTLLSHVATGPPSPSLEPAQTQVSVCHSHSGIHSLPVMVRSKRGPPRYRCSSTQLAKGPPQVCVSPSEPHCTDTVQSQGGQETSSSGGSVLAQQNLVLGSCAPIVDPSLAHSSEEGPPFSDERHNLAPTPRSLEPPPVVPGLE
ncbi:Transposon Ty3-I Gag-Pol polyprotein [Labeo rohita]|uniref:Transposon Ty3-I Gag-Pol polyprotein n=1 Tax=Labeo rohita TaxID=84645 RepID=A0ABQ8M8Q3_LABRO|nr:Transposon Ty3-I Gag-Pol polyprotein [Labeo rohita]